MNNIILFKSKKHILVEENYNEFIKFCRYQLSGALLNKSDFG